jgi:hypothetical protein
MVNVNGFGNPSVLHEILAKVPSFTLTGPLNYSYLLLEMLLCTF